MTQRPLGYLFLVVACSCTAADYPSLNGCDQTAVTSAPLGAAGAGASAEPPPATTAGRAAAPVAGSEPEIPVGTVAGSAATPQMPMTPAAGAGGASDGPAAGRAGSEPSPAPMAGASGAAMTGAGGASGAGGAPPAADGGRPALEPGALQCPNEVCAPLPELPAAAASAGFEIANCCAEGGDCGTSRNGGACNRTADSFPDCPGLSAMGFTVPSCCTPMGQCGIDGSSFMRGCMALEDIAASAGTFIEVPSPKACTPTTM